jgi:ParB family transcriptional regulator, chromosome partitioning protein
VTKDRRLGRGLAALLGSPLDEDSIVDSGVHSPSESSNRSMSSPLSAGPSLPRSSNTSPSAAISTAPETVPVSPDSKTPDSRAPDSRGPGLNKTAVTGPVPLTPASEVSKEGLKLGQSLQLSVYEIDNNPFQPRRKFNEEEIASLAASIREHEQLQPILVRSVGERYQLISGERRLRAAIHAGLKTIRAEVREADDRLVAELAIVENLQRKDLDAIEKALSFRRYIDEHRCTQEDLAKRLKIDRSTIANLMRLLELPEKIQHWIQSDKVTAGHARALLPLGDEDQQMEFARLIQEESWSVRETERRVSAQLAAEDEAADPSLSPYVKPSRKRVTPQLAALEQQLRLALGTKTEIRQNASGSGRITISFSNPDEFERLCALICPQVSQQRAA